MLNITLVCASIEDEKYYFMKRLFSLIFVLFTLMVFSAQSHPLRLAIAANAQFVIKALQADFKKRTGIETEAIIGSSGNLTAQIKNGAPYDIFLSADMNFPNTLFKEGFAITKPKEYASGSLIVCSTGNPDLKNWQKLLTGDGIKKIAIANPSVAPYGKAAEEALRYYVLWNKVNSKLVYGENISQVNTYIITGTVDIGFTTEALVYEYAEKEKLKWERIDKSVYEKIRQGFIILSYSKKENYSKAQMFYNYILSPEAKKIFKQFGYLVS